MQEFDRSSEARALKEWLLKNGFHGLDKEDAECIIQALELLATQHESKKKP
jgi:hypothetical protein